MMKIYTQLLSPQENIGNKLPGDDLVERVSLSFDDRKRGRLKLITESGMNAGIQIERGQVLRHGCWLSNDAGDLLQVLAQPEAVSTAYIEDPTLFARACYHLGNRHVPLQVGEGFLRYQQDYVLDDMLQSLGVIPMHEQAVFEPENGAYAPGTGHTHGSHGHHHHHENDSHGHHH